MEMQDVVVWIIVGGTAVYAARHIHQVLTGKKNDCHCPGCDAGDTSSNCGCSEPRSAKNEEDGHV